MYTKHVHSIVFPHLATPSTYTSGRPASLYLHLWKAHLSAPTPVEGHLSAPTPVEGRPPAPSPVEDPPPSTFISGGSASQHLHLWRAHLPAPSPVEGRLPAPSGSQHFHLWRACLPAPSPVEGPPPSTHTCGGPPPSTFTSGGPTSQHLHQWRAYLPAVLSWHLTAHPIECTSDPQHDGVLALPSKGDEGREGVEEGDRLLLIGYVVC